MKDIIKQVVGIDCSQDTLDCCYGTLSNTLEQQIQTASRFSNDPAGIKKLIVWSQKRKQDNVDLLFVVEATGVYHEVLAYALVDAGLTVAIVLPNRISNFFRTTNIKTINDPQSARMIAMFGLEKKLDVWVKPSSRFITIKQLTRERSQLIDQRTAIKNQLHAEQKGALPLASSLKRMKQLINLLNKQIEAVEKEVHEIVDADPLLKAQIENVCSAPGVGFITATTIVGEASGFDLIRNKNQLVSYAGLDVIEKQSGTSVRGKSRISGKGNKHIRKALYFPAFASIRSNSFYKNHYASLVAKHGIKMKAAVSVQRKLLVLIYSLWKTNEPYDPNFTKKESGQQSLATPTELAQGRP